jgi:interferon gamma-inducible protein 30
MSNNFFLIFISISLVYALNAKNPPTKIDIYMESLCPGCQQFTVNQVKNFLSRAGNQELAVINFIPYGNAYETKTQSGYSFTCQHGAKECRGNLIETCAINVFENSYANNFIICLESYGSGDFDTIASYCLSKDSKGLGNLKNCLNSAVSNSMQHEMAVKTNSLNPPHKWVPWIVVDGVNDDNITSTGDLAEYICSRRSDRKEITLCGYSSFEYDQLSFLSEITTCKLE